MLIFRLNRNPLKYRLFTNIRINLQNGVIHSNMDKHYKKKQQNCIMYISPLQGFMKQWENILISVKGTPKWPAIGCPLYIMHE